MFSSVLLCSCLLCDRFRLLYAYSRSSFLVFLYFNSTRRVSQGRLRCRAGSMASSSFLPPSIQNSLCCSSCSRQTSDLTSRHYSCLSPPRKVCAAQGDTILRRADNIVGHVAGSAPCSKIRKFYPLRLLDFLITSETDRVRFPCSDLLFSADEMKATNIDSRTVNMSAQTFASHSG